MLLSKRKFIAAPGVDTEPATALVRMLPAVPWFHLRDLDGRGAQSASKSAAWWAVGVHRSFHHLPKITLTLRMFKLKHGLTKVSIRFLQMKKDKAQSAWERCLKLDEVKGNKGGIDFDVAPFNCARWAIVVLPMSKSTSQMRELVEWAFDRVFKRPVASNERKQIPHAVKTALDDEQARWRKMKIETAAVFEKFDNE